MVVGAGVIQVLQPGESNSTMSGRTGQGTPLAETLRAREARESALTLGERLAGATPRSSAQASVAGLGFLNDPDLAAYLSGGAAPAPSGSGPSSGPGSPQPSQGAPSTGEIDYAQPLVDALGRFNRQEVDILQNLALQYGVQRNATTAQRDRNRGEIGDAQNIAERNISGVQRQQDIRQDTLRDAQNQSVAAQNRSRSSAQQALIDAMRSSGADIGMVGQTIAEGNNRMAREQSAGSQHLVGLQQLGSDSLMHSKATSSLVEQGGLSTLANNFAKAEAALKQSELEAKLAISREFASQRNQLELQIAQVRMEAEAAARSGGGGGGGGGGWGGGGGGGSDEEEMMMDDAALQELSYSYGLPIETLRAHNQLGAGSLNAYVNRFADQQFEDEVDGRPENQAGYAGTVAARNSILQSGGMGRLLDEDYGGRLSGDDFRAAEGVWARVSSARTAARAAYDQSRSIRYGGSRTGRTAAPRRTVTRAPARRAAPPPRRAAPRSTGRGPTTFVRRH